MDNSNTEPFLAADTDHPQKEKKSSGCTIPEPRLFVAKTLFIWVATYAFIPLIAADQKHTISATVYAVSLVVLHLVFIVVYFYKVRFRQLDNNWRSLTARVVGLLACVYLLYLVAGHLPKQLGVLSLYLLGLCTVHSLILVLLSVKVEGAVKVPPPELVDNPGMQAA